jgi:flagellar biosynthetic protein FlhB
VSENEDAESKTESATEKKLHDTLEQGKTPVSREVGTAFGVLAILASLAFIGDTVAPRLTQSISLLIGNSGLFLLRSDSDAFRYLEVVGLEVGRFLTPFLVLFVFSGIAASFVQGVPRVVVTRIAPDFSRISPRAGWSRIFGLGGLLELVKAVVKITVVGAAVAIVGASDYAEYVDAMRVDPGILPSLMVRLVIHLTSVVATALVIVALADFVWTKFKWLRDLRMSRQELKEEFKQSEGDPFVKARIRSLAMDRSRRRMIAAVPNASFVVANPTHYAIALRYVREEGGAPMVVAKGKDLVALKIREVTEANAIPVLERKELARAMFDFVEVDKMIPQEFYRPIAELIHYLDSISGRRS